MVKAEFDPKKRQVMRVIMPSKGDMDLVKEGGSELDFAPIFYGNEAMGPHIVVVEQTLDDNQSVVEETVINRYKLKLKTDGRTELKKAQ